jgi:16S rRNA processing protein RimM
LVNDDLNNDLIEILQITGAFGIRGFVRASLFSEDMSRYRRVYDAAGNGYEFRVIRYISGNSVVLSLEGIADRNAAESLRGAFFYIRRADLPELAESEYYICDLIGKTLQVRGRDDVCTIVSVHDFGAGDVIELSHNGVTFFVPFLEEYFPKNFDYITSEAISEYKN